MAAQELYATSLATDSSLQGYWRLEADGTDSSVNGYTLTGTDPAFVAGKFGNGGDFELGSSQYLQRADADCANLEIAGSQTWGCWIKPETVVTATRLTAMSKRDTSNTGKYLRISSTQNVQFGLTGLTTNAVVTSSGTVSTGTWYFLCGIYDSINTKLKIYIDTTKTEVTASGSATDSDANFAIGAEKSGVGDAAAYFFDGIIDDAFVFNRALSDAEVLALYNGTLQSKYKGAPFLMNLAGNFKNN
jgi:hypothetical protein